AGRAVPPPASVSLHLFERLRPSVVTGIVVPAYRLELSDGGDAGHDRQIPLAADFGTCRAAGVAGDPEVCGLDELEGHGDSYSAGNTSASTTGSATRAFLGRPRGRGTVCTSADSTSPSSARGRRVERGRLTPSSCVLRASSLSA